MGDGMLDAQGFRLNVAIVLIDNEDRILLAKRFKQNAWQLPQGGVNDNEDIVDALYRELQEEIGLNKEYVSIIGSTKYWLRYKIPLRMRRETESLFIGQKQKWFLLRLITDESKIRCDLNAKPEFDAWKWVSYWYPLRVVIDFKKGVYRRALKELSQFINNNKKYNQLDYIYLS